MYDFGENFGFKRKREQQSKYYMPTAATNFGCVVWVRVEDMHANLFGGEQEKQKLLQFFQSLNRLPIIFITLMAISPDLLHDQWFFQHFMDKKVLP